MCDYKHLFEMFEARQVCEHEFDAVEVDTGQRSRRTRARTLELTQHGLWEELTRSVRSLTKGRNVKMGESSTFFEMWLRWGR